MSAGGGDRMRTDDIGECSRRAGRKQILDQRAAGLGRRRRSGRSGKQRRGQLRCRRRCRCFDRRRRDRHRDAELDRSGFGIGLSKLGLQFGRLRHVEFGLGGFGAGALAGDRQRRCRKRLPCFCVGADNHRPRRAAGWRSRRRRRRDGEREPGKGDVLAVRSLFFAVGLGIEILFRQRFAGGGKDLPARRENCTGFGRQPLSAPGSAKLPEAPVAGAAGRTGPCGIAAGSDESWINCKNPR
jgi:hypothetical protein